MKEIPLTKGFTATVDDDDFEWISQHKWRVLIKPTGSHKYAVCTVSVNGKERNMLMHRIVMGCPVGMQVDHIDGNGLNNQRSNLRVCTHSENMRNRNARKNSTSAFLGVHWNKQNGKWRAAIRINGKQTIIGLYNSELEAARAYNKAALQHHGKFAHLNNTTEASNENNS